MCPTAACREAVAGVVPCTVTPLGSAPSGRGLSSRGSGRSENASPCAALAGVLLSGSKFLFLLIFSILDVLAELLNMETGLKIIPCSSGWTASFPGAVLPEEA